jgi:pimeloyl-ACP methyl ester carboxylesterase
MNRYLTILLLIIVCTSHSAFSQATPKPTYVIVHGAWGGSWAFKQVDSLLTEKGGIVYRPSLTGLGERMHLATKDVGLSTHITDVVNMILFEDLQNVILVGHSYGGMVITGVADSIPGRISKLIYLDAFVPDAGENVISLVGSREEAFKKMNVNGYLIPAWVPAGKLPPKDVPHPFKTFTDKIILKNKLRVTISTTYILTVDKGKDPKNDDFAIQADRAQKKGWPVVYLESDHNPQWSAPQALAEMLTKIERN